jgi:integrase
LASRQGDLQSRTTLRISPCLLGELAVEAIRLEWYGWHGFRRGIASNLYELGANERVVQRILRHAKPHVTKERYIKAFDPAVLAAMKSLETTLDTLNQCSAIVQQVK